MKLAIMQPYFMPYIGYFQTMAAVDKYILYSNVNFIKEAWVNRNRILMKNGEVMTITVPLSKKSSFSRINDIKIDNSQDWSRRMLRMIEMNYKHAPFFDEVFPLLKECLHQSYIRLTDLNVNSLLTIARFLDISTQIITDDNSYENLEVELRSNPVDYTNFPSIIGDNLPRKVVRILEICKRECADEYINAIGGQSLYEKKLFTNNGIKLSFVKTKDYSYKQWHHEFEPNLSIIDVLMFNGKEGTKGLLNQYELI